MSNCDVAVIGGGIVGSSIAYELAARGASVTLIESRSAGLGATQASAGMLVPYIEGFGHPILKMAVASFGMYEAFVDRVARDSGIGIGVQRIGSLQIATAEDSLADIKALAAAVSGCGITCSLLDARQTREAEPLVTPEVEGGLLIPAHAFVVAADLIGALLAAAIKHGLRVLAPSRALRVVPAGGDLEVQLEDGRLGARQVVLAAGSWSGGIDLAGIPPLPVRPVRGQLLHLTTAGPALRHITWETHRYLVPSKPGTVLAGATMEEAGFDERATVAGVRDLLEGATDIVPSLWQAAFSGTRVGLRPASPDGLPIMGRSKVLPGLTFATAHFRNGVLLAPITARAIADLVLENKEDDVLRLTSPGRFGDY